MIIIAIAFALLLGALVFAFMPRGYSAVAFIALTIMVYGGVIESMGWAKPWRLEMRSIDKAQLVGAVPIENRAIYVWLTTADIPEPRAYVLPWSKNTAQQIQDAMSQADATGTEIEMGTSTESGTDERQPLFYPRPQPASPPKDYGSHGPGPITLPSP